MDIDIEYKVDGKGAISCWQGDRRLPELYGELPISPAKRKRLRLKRTRVRTAWAVFGRRGVPNDLNEALQHEAALAQVDADAPKLLGVAFKFLSTGMLTPKPSQTVVARLKRLFTVKTTEMPKTSAKSGRRDELAYDGPNFWRSGMDAEPLTEAGWRYFLRLPYAMLRALAEHPWHLPNDFATLNALARLQAAPVTPFEYELVQRCLGALKNADSRHNFLLAFRNAKAAGHAFTAEEQDFLYDLVHAEPNLVIAPGKNWANLVGDAAEFMAQVAIAARAELEGYTWSVPIAPFVTREGVEVRVLANPGELLEEGIEMKNCLRNMPHYARRAAAGESFVAALRGAANGTAEVVLHPGGYWEVAQTARPCNQKVTSGLLWTAAQQLAGRLNEASSAACAGGAR